MATDCIHLQLYRDNKERRKNATTKSSLSLEGFLGMETGFTLDKESNTMALICSEMTVILGFDSRETLLQWQAKLRVHLPEGQQFLVQLTHLPARSKLATGPARVHLQDKSFCIVTGIPPKLSGTWTLQQLRKYGLIEGKFCFEGGSSCGKGEGLHVLHTNQADELSRAFDLASSGKLVAERKAVLKKSQLDSLCRLSATPNCVRKRITGHHESTESSRPLLSTSSGTNSSGSDGSGCDGCSDVLRFSSCNGSLDICDCSSDETYSSKSTCYTSLRWSSISGGSSRGPGHGFPSLVSLPCDVGDSELSTNGKLSENHRCVFSFSSCGRCGRNFCSGLDGNECPTDVSNNMASRTVSVNTISTLLTDFRASSPMTQNTNGCPRNNSHHHLNNGHHIHHHSLTNGNLNMDMTTGPGILSDRTSLCSQSSHSSSTSSAGSSTGYQSEYSVPRGSNHSLADTLSAMLYDRPKCAVRQGLDEGNITYGCQCDCSRSKTPVNGTTEAPGGHCSCPTSGSPKKQLAVLPVASNGQVPQTNPYLNYQIPRTALANMYIREKQAQANGHKNGAHQHHHQLNRNNDQSAPLVPPKTLLASEVYDIPKNFRDIICDQSKPSEPSKTFCPSPLVNNCHCIRPVPVNGQTRTALGKSCSNVANSSAIDGATLNRSNGRCCQRQMVHRTPSFNSNLSSSCSSQAISEDKPAHISTSGHLQSCRAKSNSVVDLNSSTVGQNHNYINIDYTVATGDEVKGSDIESQAISSETEAIAKSSANHNYVNMNFVQSSPSPYQNNGGLHLYPRTRPQPLIVEEPEEQEVV
ncbi:Protein Dok-7 [Halotydeus destructor]|nr:Protein Dok-7 [Halotydeus destructor]